MDAAEPSSISAGCPQHERGLATLVSLSGHAEPGRPAVQQALDGIVQHVVTAFTDMIGI